MNTNLFIDLDGLFFPIPPFADISIHSGLKFLTA